MKPNKEVLRFLWLVENVNKKPILCLESAKVKALIRQSEPRAECSELAWKDWAAKVWVAKAWVARVEVEVG